MNDPQSTSMSQSVPEPPTNPGPGVQDYIDIMERAFNPLVHRLFAALNHYGQHTSGCAGKYPEYRCTCGWRETAASFGVSEGPEK